MPRDYARKLEAMRAYAKTPEGKASKKASQERWIAKRRGEHVHETLTINPKPLLAAIKHWGTI